MTFRVLGAIALAAGALVTAAGSFLPLYGIVEAFQDYRLELVVTPWEDIRRANRELGFGVGHGPRFGPPLLVAAALLGVAAVLLLKRPAPHPVGRLAAVLGAGLLVGVVWSAALHTAAEFSSAVQAPVIGIGVDRTVGSGLWALGVAAVVALAGALAVQEWPRRAPRPTGPVVHQFDDERTPPFGIPLNTEERPS